MNGFDVRAARHFERALKKLARASAGWRQIRGGSPDPQRRSLQPDPPAHLRKLEGVAAGEGQYRIRMRRFRFIYDIEAFYPQQLN
jgi:mRNA-degrading endonuclease RelE of RelBE toxin-antitoxin system